MIALLVVGSLVIGAIAFALFRSIDREIDERADQVAKWVWRGAVIWFLGTHAGGAGKASAALFATTKRFPATDGRRMRLRGERGVLVADTFTVVTVDSEEPVARLHLLPRPMNGSELALDLTNRRLLVLILEGGKGHVTLHDPTTNAEIYHCLLRNEMARNGRMVVYLQEPMANPDDPLAE